MFYLRKKICTALNVYIIRTKIGRDIFQCMPQLLTYLIISRSHVQRFRITQKEVPLYLRISRQCMATSYSNVHLASPTHWSCRCSNAKLRQFIRSLNKSLFQLLGSKDVFSGTHFSVEFTSKLLYCMGDLSFSKTDHTSSKKEAICLDLL